MNLRRSDMGYTKAGFALFTGKIDILTFTEQACHIFIPFAYLKSIIIIIKLQLKIF